MATTKKSTKRSTAKKPAVKRAPAKASTAKVTHHTTKHVQARKTKKEQFMTFRVTHEACYWAVFGAAVILLALWVLSVNVKLNKVYDQIDQMNDNTNTIVVPQHHKNAR